MSIYLQTIDKTTRARVALNKLRDHLIEVNDKLLPRDFEAKIAMVDGALLLLDQVTKGETIKGRLGKTSEAFPSEEDVTRANQST